MKKIIILFKGLVWCCLGCVILTSTFIFFDDIEKIENEFLEGLILYGILGILISMSIGLYISVDESLVKMSNFDWSLDSVKSLNYLRGSLSYVYFSLFLVIGSSVYFLYSSDFSCRNLNFILFVLSVLLYTGLVIYSYYRVTFCKKDSIFLLRALLFITIFYTLGIVLDNIIYYVNSDDKIASLRFTDKQFLFFGGSLFAIAVVSASIKGLLITYSNKAKAAFPKSERVINLFDIFFSLSVASYLLFYRFLLTHIIDINLLFMNTKNIFLLGENFVI